MFTPSAGYSVELKVTGGAHVFGASMSIDTGNNPRTGGNYLKRATEMCIRAGLSYVEPFIKDLVGNYCNVMTVTIKDTIFPFYVVARGPPYAMGEHRTQVVSVANTLHVMAKGNDRPIVMGLFMGKTPHGDEVPAWHCFNAKLNEATQLGHNTRGHMDMINFPLDSGAQMVSPMDVVHHAIRLHKRLDGLQEKGQVQSSLGRWG